MQTTSNTLTARGIILQSGTTVADVVERTAEQVFVPLTVGGGIRTLEDFQLLLRAGADKISVNSAAVKDPTLISRAAERFGSQCVVLAIDARSRGDGTYEVVVAGGRTPTGLDAVEWAKKGEALGAGEILLTSMDADGTKTGFDLDMTREVTAAVGIPVIASGGCGSLRRLQRRRDHLCSPGIYLRTGRTDHGRPYRERQRQPDPHLERTAHHSHGRCCRPGPSRRDLYGLQRRDGPGRH